MTTFERVRENILRDMASRQTHTAESWAHIMLDNTRRLTDTDEQTKFWEFMQNPTGEEHLPPPTCAASEHTMIEQPDTIICPLAEDDEKSGDVEMNNKYFRNGMSMYISSKPNKDSSESEPLPADQVLIGGHSDEKTETEML